MHKPAHTFVLELAFAQITSHIGVAVMRKFREAHDEDVQGVRASCEKFPYLRIVSESPNHVHIELVPEAISAEGMAAQVEEVIATPIAKVFSPQKTAGLGNAEYPSVDDGRYCRIAGPCQEFIRTACHKRVPSRSGTRSGPAKVFHQRHHQVAEFLAWEVVDLVLNVLDVDSKRVSWLESLLGLRSTEYYLRISVDADRNSHPVLEWATKTYAGMPDVGSLAVAETLREGGWRGISDEQARRGFYFSAGPPQERGV